ncbi:DnaJ-domain-containing protein [Metschnikowia bicuspidata var. bicuspidata NRRL YB-4993]|uniref:DnaJ-domain-containing protein n=1 Tax=Metschnikowia bicuspidata var. bicuspidata NRRL YB-4993 TaxID=869754 RepID=A0A1A0H4G2_9ASCO|nr:DnaJ-domain-containing protein [Metschnikowia bicuspidata var. bicuspidata NRRL YB-4993]OBA18964.1 DnaJ-domain-containing protein [Metschnikowia bicuspidata var. bicuspidata NRRL YB-4993]
MTMEFDLYKTLCVSTTASPVEIKKAYKKLSLQYHPDKIQQLETNEDKDYFPKIQLAYSVLSDPQKRKIYDTTGSYGNSSDFSAGDFDWKEYFQNMTEKITIDMIDEDREKYQKSLEEKDDILHNFVYYEGDFLRLFEVIPHLEFDEALENRVFDMIDKAVSNDEIAMDKTIQLTWNKYKKSRKTKVKQVLKKMAKEAQEAAELAKIIGQKKASGENDLKAMIQKNSSGRMDDLILSLEAKYGRSKGKKRSVPDDEEFAKIQAQLTKGKKRRK